MRMCVYMEWYNIAMDWHGTQDVFQYYNSKIAPQERDGAEWCGWTKTKSPPPKKKSETRTKRASLLKERERTIVITFMLESIHRLFIYRSISSCCKFSCLYLSPVPSSCLRTHLFRTIKYGTHAQTHSNKHMPKCSRQRLFDMYIVQWLCLCLSVLIKWRYNELSSCRYAHAPARMCVRKPID